MNLQIGYFKCLPVVTHLKWAICGLMHQLTWLPTDIPGLTVLMLSLKAWFLYELFFIPLIDVKASIFLTLLLGNTTS